MPLVIGLFIGIIAGLTVPFAVKETPNTFGGMLSGNMLYVPGLDTSVHWSWPVFGLVTVLVWVLLKVAKS